VIPLVVDTGDDPLTAPIVEHLQREYNIPKDHIRRVQLDSEVGSPQLVTVTLYVHKPKEPTDG
jgi:hypothetical protein